MSDSIGARLRSAREARRLTLAQVSETTKVRAHYLQALENDDVSAMPSAAQARGFLRLYADFLGLDLAELVPPPAPAPAAIPEPVTAPTPKAQDAVIDRVKSAAPRILDQIRGRLSRRNAKGAEPDTGPSATTTFAEHADTAAHEDGSLPSGRVGRLSSILGAIKKKRPDATVAEVSSAPSGVIPRTVTPAPAAPESAASESASRGPGRWDRLRMQLSRWLTKLRRPPSEAIDEARLSDETSEEMEAESEEPFANARDFNPLPAEPAEGGATSEQIFAEIGRQLRTRRELLSLTFEEIERHTKVRGAFLKGLEEGRLDGLPSPVQTRGILANYAGFIDLDVDAILLRFADGLQARHREQKPSWPPRTRSPMAVHTDLPPLRAFIASDLLFGGGVAIMLVLFSLWGISRILTVRASNPARPTSPSISDVLAGTAMPTLPQQVTLIPADDTSVAATPSPTASPAFFTIDPNTKVELVLSAAESTYMRVSADGNLLFEGRADPGQNYSYRALKQIEVVTGNGAGLRVTYNGTDLGLMGSFGEVVDRIYSAEGVATPTTTPLPTRTPTPIPTGTTTPTPTLATYTPTPKPRN